MLCRVFSHSHNTAVTQTLTFTPPYAVVFAGKTLVRLDTWKRWQTLAEYMGKKIGRGGIVFESYGPRRTAPNPSTPEQRERHPSPKRPQKRYATIAVAIAATIPPSNLVSLSRTLLTKALLHPVDCTSTHPRPTHPPSMPSMPPHGPPAAAAAREGRPAAAEAAPPPEDDEADACAAGWTATRRPAAFVMYVGPGGGAAAPWRSSFDDAPDPPPSPATMDADDDEDEAEDEREVTAPVTAETPEKNEAPARDRADGGILMFLSSSAEKSCAELS